MKKPWTKVASLLLPHCFWFLHILLSSRALRAQAALSLFLHLQHAARRSGTGNQELAECQHVSEPLTATPGTMISRRTTAG